MLEYGVDLLAGCKTRTDWLFVSNVENKFVVVSRLEELVPSIQTTEKNKTGPMGGYLYHVRRTFLYLFY